MFSLTECNPYVRLAMIQGTLAESDKPRRAYDNRIFYIRGGDGEITVNGEKYSVGENTLIFIPLGGEYFFRGRVEAVVINFDLTMLCRDRVEPVAPDLIEEYDEEKVFDRTVAEGIMKHLVINSGAAFREDVTLLLETYIGGANYSDALCSAYLKKILVTVAQAVQDRGEGAANGICRDVLTYIRENAERIRKNSEIAEAFGYHPVYLGELFRAQTGRTLHRALTEEKLRIGQRQLLYTDKSVESIALDLGFSSRNHFCTLFKSCFGTSPLAYRTKNGVFTI